MQIIWEQPGILKPDSLWSLSYREAKNSKTQILV